MSKLIETPMRNEFLEAVLRYANTQSGEGAFATPIDGLTILRADSERRPSQILLKPALCIVVQGSKSTMVGKIRHDYRAGQALVVSAAVPGSGRITQASAAEPFLGVVIEFDLGIMREVAVNLGMTIAGHVDLGGATFVSDFAGPLADCARRLVGLLETPHAIAPLYTGLMREICYWLLTGPNGSRIAGTALATWHPQRILEAAHTLRERYAQTVSIRELASAAKLSASAFHRQFKALTSMTPLQYQKRLRLIEARRLIVSNAGNIETVAFQVGYASPSQFSREYSRMFGIPPRRDIVSLRVAVA